MKEVSLCSEQHIEAVSFIFFNEASCSETGFYLTSTELSAVIHEIYDANQGEGLDERAGMFMLQVQLSHPSLPKRVSCVSIVALLCRRRMWPT